MTVTEMAPEDQFAPPPEALDRLRRIITTLEERLELGWEEQAVLDAARDTLARYAL